MEYRKVKSIRNYKPSIDLNKLCDLGKHDFQLVSLSSPGMSTCSSFCTKCKVGTHDRFEYYWRKLGVTKNYIHTGYSLKKVPCWHSNFENVNVGTIINNDSKNKQYYIYLGKILLRKLGFDVATTSPWLRILSSEDSEIDTTYRHTYLKNINFATLPISSGPKGHVTYTGHNSKEALLEHIKLSSLAPRNILRTTKANFNVGNETKIPVPSEGNYVLIKR